MESFCFNGHSGCKIEVSRKDGETTVRKHSSEDSYNERLGLQAAKQERFRSIIHEEEFDIPKVLAVEKDHFDMRFFYGKDMVTHFSSCGVDSIDDFCSRIFKLIQFEIDSSQVEDFRKDMFLNKFHTIKAELTTLNAGRIERYFNALPVDNIPHGICHGDLSLTNMLVDRLEKKICLIDFLDTFYETPLQDVVKLRQDTKYLWSMLFYNSMYDSTRYKIVMSYIDKQVENFMSGFRWYQLYYRPFQIMNFLRILPYATGTKRDFVARELNDMVKEWT